LLPALALGGFTQMGREITAWSQPEDVDQRALALRAALIPPAARARLDTVEWIIYGVFAAALGGVLLARAARTVVAHRTRIRVSYPDGRVASVPPGFTVLEASRLAGIPHASVCGGRGRCSTCRVRIERGIDKLPPPTTEEARVLRRVGAPPGVRLACQTRPSSDVAVVPLITATTTATHALDAAAAETGREQEVAVLFADLRGFTSIAERKLPYDVVYLLNRYFEAVGGAVREAGGVANQFTGDGVMALFGVAGAAADAARDAIRGAAGMVAAIEALNRSLADELPAPLKLGIGIHVGLAVVGRMGFAEAAYLTAVGDTVHVAARLEELTKKYTCELVISEAVAGRAGVDVSGYPRDDLTLRNRSAPLAIRVIDDARGLAAALPGAAVVTPT
jgi:adenylate cyclase